MTGQADTLTAAAGSVRVDAEVRAVLVDARHDRRSVMRQVFEHSGIDVAVVGEADGRADALDLVGQTGANLVVVEMPAAVPDGLDLVAGLRHRFPDVAIVVISFNTDGAVKEQARSEGADAYLVKPVSGREIVAAMPPHPASKP